MAEPGGLPQVVSHWDLAVAQATPLFDGLINPTWRLVDASGAPLGVLQQLHSGIFQPTVHEDIEAVTAHLAAAGLLVPRLLRTREGALWATHASESWRVLSWVGERTVHKLQGAEGLRLARSGGELVARAHGALTTLDHTFVHVRTGAHDTPRHVQTAQDALAAHPSHRLRDQVAPLVQSLTDTWDRLRHDLPADLPSRVVHGDLKISNLRFVEEQAVALIDLDTFARADLGTELGDMLRSWCNPAAEDDVAGTRLDLPLLLASLEGYARGAGTWGPTPDEWQAIVPSIARIALELTARFAADALHEAYFGFDVARYPTRGEHNLARAKGQWSLVQSVLAQRAAASRQVAALRRSGT